MVWCAPSIRLRDRLLPKIDWNSINNALYNATYNDSSIKREHISILGPCFFTEDDLAAGAAQDGQLLYGATTWIDGHHNVAPDSVSDYSSFDVLDALVAYYMDKTIYPNLKVKHPQYTHKFSLLIHAQVLVVGGHSAGGQTAQRYATLRKSTKNDDRLQFWIGKPHDISENVDPHMSSQPRLSLLANPRPSHPRRHLRRLR